MTRLKSGGENLSDSQRWAMRELSLMTEAAATGPCIAESAEGKFPTSIPGLSRE